MPRLENKIAIVTGATSGIGKATVELFVEEGARVVALDVNAPTEPLPQGVHFIKGSVADTALWDQAIADSKSKWGSAPDVLVNAAGVSTGALLHELTDDDFDFVFGINFRAPMKGMQAVIRALLAEGKPGSIVNISSVLGHAALPTKTAYGVSKAALSHATAIAAKEYGEKGIRVNAIAPAMVRTGMTAPSDVTARLDTLVDRTSLKRWGEPREIAQSILFLASDDASLVTGTVLKADAGYTT